MNRRGYSSNYDEPQPDFEHIFSSQGFTAIQLLDIDSIVDQVKRNSQKFTLKLIEHPQILLDLFDICLRPQSFSKQHNDTPLNRQLVFRSIQIITNLQNDDFAQFLLGSSKKSTETGQDDVIQDQPSTDRDFSNFMHMFKILQDEKRPIDQTAASYLNKILTPLFYQKSSEVDSLITQIIGIFLEKKDILQMIFNHYYSRSISDIFFKLIQLEDSNYGFYEKQKNSLINKLIQALHNQKDLQLMTEALENLATFFDTLLEKYDDKFDRGKYLNLLRQVVNQKNNYLFLIEKSKQNLDNEDVQYSCCVSLETLLRFSTGQKISSINSSKLSESNLMDSSFSDIKINQQVINQIQKYIINSSASVLQGDFKSVKIPYYRIIQSINLIDPSFIEKIVQQNFIHKIFISMIKSPKNNILHNIQKDLLIDAVKKTEKAYEIILTGSHCEYITLAENVLSEKNSKFCYENQIFHITKIIITKIQSLFGSIQKSELKGQVKQSIQNLKSICQKKKDFYSKQIGGNPRKQSNSWDCSSNQIILGSLGNKELANFLTGKQTQQENENASPLKDDDKQDDKIISSENHWFDNQLPLDSDQSDQQKSKQGNQHPNSPVQLNQNIIDLQLLSGCSELLNSNISNHQTYEQNSEQIFDSKRFNSYLSFDLDQLCKEL